MKANLKNKVIFVNLTPQILYLDCKARCLVKLKGRIK